MMKFSPPLMLPALLLAAGGSALFFAQIPTPPSRPTAASLPTGELLGEPGPTFRFENNQLPSPLTLIVCGDQRFTDPANIRSADPRVRLWLVNQIARERPAAVLLNGDVPLNGDVKNDYAEFQSETKAWRDAGLRVFPALGNHEFAGDDPKQAL
jgi:hypothetical protein